MEAEAIIVATGGSSYPASGTSGDGWEWMRKLGHTIVQTRAALAPIEIQEPHTELAGVAVRDAVLKARQGKRISRWRADVLFTHRGLSGPATLGVSREVSEMLEAGDVTMELDLAPDESFESLSDSIRRFCAENPKKHMGAWMGEFGPAAVVDRLLGMVAVGLRETMASNVSQKQRNRIIELIKGWPLGSVSEVVLEKGEVVAGGVALDEVDPQTMASKLVPRLFLCGEVLDIAGPVGGYNLQAALATGYVAGESAAR